MMTLTELKVEKKELGKQFGEITKEINRVREEIKAKTPVGQPYRNHPALVELREKRDKIQKRMLELDEIRNTQRNQMILAEREAQMRLDELDAREYYMEEERNMKAMSRRPNGEQLTYLYEFDKMTGTKRRLAILMIREIGLDRFLELRRIASWDERHGNDAYYKTGRD